jgi:hypothetical protein
MILDYLQIAIHVYDDSYQAYLSYYNHTIALVHQSVNNGSVTMTGEMKIARYSIDLKKSFHSAAFL